jgi:hypothetical protein
MNNVKFEIVKGKREEGDQLVITVNLKERHGLSGSGNTVTIAGTSGNQRIGVGDIAFGLNVYTKDGLPAERLKAAKEAGYANWEEYQKARGK